MSTYASTDRTGGRICCLAACVLPCCRGILNPNLYALMGIAAYNTISHFYMAWAVVQIEKEKKKHTGPPTSLLGQLLWREFFYSIGSQTPNFDHMVGNDLCKQIDWDVNHEWYQAWEESRTGYPWIDAIMKQLHHDGWLHHLARHATARSASMHQSTCMCPGLVHTYAASSAPTCPSPLAAWLWQRQRGCVGMSQPAAQLFCACSASGCWPAYAGRHLRWDYL